MKRSFVRNKHGDWLFVGWVLVTVLVCAMVIRAEMHRSDLAAAAGRGVARDVPMERLLQRIETKQLARKPAMHAKPLTGTAHDAKTRPLDTSNASVPRDFP